MHKALRNTGMVTATLLLCLAATSSRAQGPPFVVKQLAPHVWAAVADITGASGNSGFVIDDDGVLVIDSLGNPAAARQLLAEIRRLTTRPVRYVANTHHHFDHAAGNQVFVDAGAVVLGQRNV